MVKRGPTSGALHFKCRPPHPRVLKSPTTILPELVFREFVTLTAKGWFPSLEQVNSHQMTGNQSWPKGVPNTAPLDLVMAR